MIIFNAASTRRTLCPWGEEVKLQLLKRRMQQEDLLAMMRASGFEISKQTLSNLLYGLGTSARQQEVIYISRQLGIPFQEAAVHGQEGVKA